MLNPCKRYFYIVIYCLPVIFTACQNPSIKHVRMQPDQIIFTENVNYERQNFTAKDFIHPLQLIREESINGVTTPFVGLCENQLILTTQEGYLSILPVNDIGKHHKTRPAKGATAAPTLYGYKLFMPMVEDEHGLQVYDVIKGQLIWELEGNFSHSSPVVVNDLVYHASRKGVIYCLRAESGEKVWQVNINDNIHANLIYKDNNLIAVSQNGLIQIYDPSTGLLKMTKNIEDHVYAQPILVNQFLYIISYHGQLWKFNINTGKIIRIKSYHIKAYASLSSDGQQLVISLSDGRLISKDIHTHDDLWVINLKGPASCPIMITNNCIIVGTSQRYVYIIDKQNGNILQTITLEGRLSAPPVISGTNVIMAYEYDKIALFKAQGEDINASVNE